MAEPKISIVTVCYNSEKTIKRTIESVICQNYPNLEYIIIDGNSCDETLKIVDSYVKKYPYIVASSEPDKGISDAFNKGIKRATGVLVGLINSDDELADGALKLVATSYKKNHADVIYGDTIVIDEENNLLIKKKVQDMKMIKYEMPFIHQSCYISKKSYEECGGYDGQYKICMDYDMIARLYHQGKKFAYAEGVLSVFWYGGTSCEHPFRTINEDLRVARKYGLKIYEELPYRVKVTIRNSIKFIMVRLGLWSKLYNLIKKDYS